MTPQVRVMRFSGRRAHDRRRGARHRGCARAHLRAAEDRRRLLPLPQQDRLRRALEALRDCYQLRLATADELWECAQRAARGQRHAPVYRVAAVTKTAVRHGGVGVLSPQSARAIARSEPQSHADPVRVRAAAVPPLAISALALLHAQRCHAVRRSGRRTRIGRRATSTCWASVWTRPGLRACPDVCAHASTDDGSSSMPASLAVSDIRGAGVPGQAGPTRGELGSASSACSPRRLRRRARRMGRGGRSCSRCSTSRRRVCAPIRRRPSWPEASRDGPARHAEQPHEGHLRRAGLWRRGWPSTARRLAEAVRLDVRTSRAAD